jgi:cation diffusion facilitator CzcD-associated flavoprotein CzcO
MSATETLSRGAVTKIEHFDVLVVGAGISGVGAAYHLETQSRGTSYVVLETQETFGGTWSTHTYPGIRSDSDLYTFGYRFKPWVNAPIASAEEILKYMGEVIAENDIGRHIRYRHKILKTAWSSLNNTWTVEAVRLDTDETVTFTCNFLWMCQGYYRHDVGYTPDWEGMEDYQGQVIHPQSWPKDIDLTGKKVLLIGSGATAATLVPAIAGKCAHVTMLQRSPTYFIPGRNANELADTLRQLEINETWIHEIVRRKILFDGGEFTRRSFEEPEVVRNELLSGVRAFLGDEAVQENFTPKYRPWSQRIAFVPEGDLFKSVIAGQASVVTDEIDRFVPEGVKLKSGKVIEADVVVTATGFHLSVLGDIEMTVDGKPLDMSKTVTYRGMMFTGVPNLVWVFGYFRASWTLRVDLLGDFVCRLLDHMKKKGVKRVSPELRPEDKDMTLGPWMDPEDFNPGYLQRGGHLLPKSGDKPEWRHSQDYWREKDELPKIDLDDPIFRYGN